MSPQPATGDSLDGGRGVRQGAVPDYAGEDPPVLWLRQLLGRGVLGPECQHLGHVRDVVVQRTGGRAGRLVSGVIIDVGGQRCFIPVAAVRLEELTPRGCRLTFG
jgi:hypothetical protein